MKGLALTLVFLLAFSAFSVEIETIGQEKSLASEPVPEKDLQVEADEFSSEPEE